ncbi:pentapeptide repeat-containing protein [Streptomyces sp. NPDC058268]|uniref:pentapeptide repeat-containing protein n=1 Tax=Streptomyces sp. NPDC058268 TaxID=3346413 RepID=UPI0036E5AB52
MAAAAAAAAAAIWFTTGWLLDATGQALDGDAKTTGSDRAGVKVEAVRTGLAAGAGAGAAVGLMLALRRQAHQEYDSAERRVTELYNAAAEQLGSDKAPVRLTALYTLERLANDTPRHRQTIVNIICAYLRMPPPPGNPEPTPPTGPDPREEHQVRLTAQRLLTTHLNPRAPGPYWVDPTPITLDLTGATLVDLDLRDCTLSVASFVGATFTGIASFGVATFIGIAYFGEATFTGNAYFGRATFTGDANFVGATFTGIASFVGATFTADADFVMAAFTADANFGGATFIGNANFGRATFTGEASFREATFGRMSLRDARVADVGLAHNFPANWRIERTVDPVGRLVEDTALPPSPAPG